MPVQKLKNYLDKNQVKYVKISHSPAYTALEIAAMAHIPGKELAKTVMVKIDGQMSMLVLPASYKVDFDLLKAAFAAKKAELSTEQEFMELFPDCEIGGMPPFGNLYNMDVYVAQSLAEDDRIAFNAGSHSELIQMYYSDYEKLVKPMVLKFSEKYA